MEHFEPYYVAIFTSVKTDNLEGYNEMNDLLFEKVKSQKGYMGAESFSKEDGTDVTIVSFKTREDMLSWKNQSLHVEAQETGRKNWYKYYNVKICRVEKEYEFNKNLGR